MARKPWAAYLPSDLIEAVTARRFTGESDGELSNRLILDLIDWIRKDTLEAVRSAPLSINLGYVEHPERVGEYLSPALDHPIGVPSGELRDYRFDALIKDPRVAVTSRLPEPKVFWQFKASKEVDAYLRSVRPRQQADNKSWKMELALRWACQTPRLTEWQSQEDYFQWLQGAYGMKQVPIATAMRECPRRASSATLRDWLNELSLDDRIKLSMADRSQPWVTVGGVGMRSLQVCPPKYYRQVGAYAFRDAISKRNPHNPAYFRMMHPILDGKWIQVAWRKAAIGFLVDAEVGATLVKGEVVDLNLQEMRQPEFFREFASAIQRIRDLSLDGARITTTAGDQVMLFALAK